MGEPQNLVSYHLGKLRDGRLVSADRVILAGHEPVELPPDRVSQRADAAQSPCQFVRHVPATSICHRSLA